MSERKSPIPIRPNQQPEPVFDVKAEIHGEVLTLDFAAKTVQIRVPFASRIDPLSAARQVLQGMAYELGRSLEPALRKALIEGTKKHDNGTGNGSILDPDGKPAS